MAHFKCEKHYGAGVRELCECLDQDISKGLFPNTYELDNSEVVCKSCAEFICTNYNPTNVNLETLDIFDGAIELSVENWSLFYAEYNKTSVGWCALCYWDFKVKKARHENKPLTIDAYEKTLEYWNKPIIDKLHEYLLSSYPFRLKLYYDNYCYSHSLPNTTGMKALEVYEGHILRPLTISVWYVTEEKEQKQVLAIIEHFFENEEKYQRRIIFYEAETPRLEADYDEDGCGGTTKEDEVILLDILIK